MTDTFERNLATLEKHDSLTLEEITRKGKYCVDLIETEAGLTLKINDVFLHDPKSPSSEHKNIPDHPMVHIVFGLGLGYVFDALPNNKNAAILIWEPEPNVAKVWVEVAPLSQHLTRNNIRVTCSFERFAFLAQRMVAIYGQYNFVSHAGHIKAFPEDFEKLQVLIGSLQNDLKLKWANRIGPLILQSSYRSLPEYASCPGAEKMRGGSVNVPAIIVAAGPSLEKNLSHLREYQDRILIFSLARTVAPLLRESIQPDYIVQVEAQDYSHLVEPYVDQLDHALFLLADQTHPKFYRLGKRRTLVFRGEGNSVTKCLNAAFPQYVHEASKSGGSVATVAFYFAFLMGCNPIILIGQDLALTGNKWYGYSEDRHDAQATLKVPGYTEGTVLTLPAYAQNIWWYEKAVLRMKEREPERRFINATEGGAHIPEFEHIPLASILETLKDAKNIPVLPSQETIPVEALQEFLSELNVALKELKKWQKALAEGTKGLESRLSRDAFLEDPQPTIDAFKTLLADHPRAKPLFEGDLAALRHYERQLESQDGFQVRCQTWGLIQVLQNNVKRLVDHLKS